MTLNTLWAGASALISNTTTARAAVSPEFAALLQTYNSVSVVQSGFFVPTQTGNHSFKVNTGNGVFLALNGQILLNQNNFSGWANSANISLVAGQSYSFLYSVPVINRGVTSLLYSFNGGSDENIQNNQIYSTTDINSNPIHNANAILQGIIGSMTPSYISPLANLIATNITANTLIATVPCPAIIPSISNPVLRSMENQFHYPCPVQTPVSCYRDIVVRPPIVDPPSPPPAPQSPTGTVRRGGGRPRKDYLQWQSY